MSPRKNTTIQRFFILLVAGLLPAMGSPLICIAQNAQDPVITEINFTGGSVFPKSTLKTILRTRESGIFHKNRLNTGALKNDLASIEFLYQQRGYLDAAAGYTLDLNKEKNTVTVTIDIDEGMPTITESISFLGNVVFPDTVLMKHIEIRPGEALSADSVLASALTLTNFYLENGYIDAKISPETKVNSEQKRALIDFVVDEGQLAMIDSIIIRGTVKTRKSVITRELTFKRGEVVNLPKLRKAEYDLYLLGLFQSVFIQPEPSGSGIPGRKNIIIAISENKNGEVSASAGYGTLDRFRVSLQVYENNLQGTARKIGLTGKLSHLERLAQISTSAPRFLGTQWLAEATLANSFERQPGYNFLTWGGGLSLGRYIFSRNNRLTFYSRYENDTLKNVHTVLLPENFSPKIRSFSVSLLHDTRDNLFDSRKGMYATISMETGVFRVEKGVNYFRINTDLRAFYPLNNKTVIGTAAEFGWISAPGGIAAIPLEERYYTGGPNSVRGFAYQKLGPLDANRLPIGGRFLFVWHVLEVRRSLLWKISGVLFCDAGNVWTDAKDFKLFSLKSVVGPGLRMNSPIGLIRLDYGLKLGRRPHESRSELYLSMGQAF